MHGAAKAETAFSAGRPRTVAGCSESVHGGQQLSALRRCETCRPALACSTSRLLRSSSSSSWAASVVGCGRLAQALSSASTSS
ncbi:hypothetical protein AFM16_04830 [Streptomyces antibioticus]|uniref:Uncharacterized protein n=1 Tax=Streptomyces antibioticus TaxID=1890 RepID=A0ABX3LSP8_STRAT|nr:hypothetical protein AFM16_04830 [Streptomyces antibioticus]